MTRGLIVFFAAVIVTFQLTVIILGYSEYGTYPDLGTRERIDRFDTRLVSVSPEGYAAGLRTGDIVDARRLTLSQRLAEFWSQWKAGAVFTMPVNRAGKEVIVHVPVASARSLALGQVVDVLIRILFFAAGFLLIARGEGSAGLWGGIAVISLPLSQGYGFSWGAVPIAAGATAFLIQSIAYIPNFVARYFFATSLLREQQRRLPAAISIAFWIGMAFLAAALIVRRVEAFTGFSLDEGGRYFQCCQLSLGILFVIIFAYIAAKSPAGSSLRVLFWSYALGTIGPTLNQILVISGYGSPAGGLLNLTYIFFAIGFVYAVFAKRLVAVNFFISRAAIYTIVLAVIIGVFVLSERLVESAAIGTTPSLILELVVPLSLGLSFRWIERYAERIVERLLYREKQSAQEALENLIADFPHARKVSTLERSVVDDVHRLMHARSVALYRESELGYEAVTTSGDSTYQTVGPDDRAFVRMRATLKPVYLERVHSELSGVLAFPLIVVGQVTGALVVGECAHSEPYDPDEIALLSRLAHELAVTLLWAEREPLHLPTLGTPV